MVLRADRPEKLLHGVRGAVYGELVFVRTGTEPGRAGDFPNLAGRGGRRLAAERTSDSERYVSAGEAWHGVCDVWARCGCGANDWAMAGRLDHGQFFVEMDFLRRSEERR